MKNKKKIFFKNRVKCFYTESGNHGRNRIKGDKGNCGPLEGNDKEEEGDLENPEEQGDLS